jgi:hypothetical protein
MPRPFTDIARAVINNPIKNGTTIACTTPTGNSSIYSRYVKNDPELGNIQQKYGNRFYNGIFVNVLSGDLNGGTSLS